MDILASVSVAGDRWGKRKKERRKGDRKETHVYLAGHSKVDSKVPLLGYATWLLWSGLSTLTPSQQVGKKLLMRRPYGHGVVGKVRVSHEPPISDCAGAGPQGVVKQRKAMLLNSSTLGLGSRKEGLPMSMRKPWVSSVSIHIALCILKCATFTEGTVA